ncbi:MAG: aminodeoxychorismate/anthranilate synthase component II [Saprospiraceae bacterium]|nr:aminodeoxychorismate/anthranilate synthase component II [Saprospiraceae bacterium]
MRILVIDNYDSFTYNLVQYISEIAPYPIDVFRNDAIPLGDVELYDIIVLSPGPGVPSNSGITPDVVKRYASSKSILGVCLGHQAIGEAFGGKLSNLSKVYHGIATEVNCVGEDVLFKGMPEQFEAGRYHSWVVLDEGFPECLEVTARDKQGTIMALRHKEHNVRGVQFHPESILTPMGKQILSNFFEHSYRHQSMQEIERDSRNLA